MSERESQPGLDGGDGTSPSDDLRSFELPSGLVADLKREFRTSDPVPVHVDFAVLSAFEQHHKASAGRRNAWRFAAVAASVAAVVWVGSATWPRSKPLDGTKTNLAINDGYGTGSVAGGVGAAANDRRMLAERSDKRMPESGQPVELATVDADGNGRVNILDAMRMAKTVEAVRLVRAYRDKPDASGEAGEMQIKARMAFFVESLDVTWDLTADGVVDQKDADLLAARIVSVGKGGV